MPYHLAGIAYQELQVAGGTDPSFYSTGMISSLVVPAFLVVGSAHML